MKASLKNLAVALGLSLLLHVVRVAASPGAP